MGDFCRVEIVVEGSRWIDLVFRSYALVKDFIIIA